MRANYKSIHQLRATLSACLVPAQPSYWGCSCDQQESLTLVSSPFTRGGESRCLRPPNPSRQPRMFFLAVNIYNKKLPARSSSLSSCRLLSRSQSALWSGPAFLISPCPHAYSVLQPHCPLTRSHLHVFTHSVPLRFAIPGLSLSDLPFIQQVLFFY